jgi:4-hydroxybenzoate polyprenyltransferase
MSQTIRSLAVVSRAEFLLPNLVSLAMGVAWGANSSLSLNELAVAVILSFVIINLSSAIGAQTNSLSDYDLDSMDERKKKLVHATDCFGQTRLKLLLAFEFLLALTLSSLATLIYGKPILLFVWIVGIFLGYAYSAPPLRLKSRSWLALAALILVLSILPVLFVYCIFTFELNSLFLLSTTGLTLTIYGLIIPTEIRDYFGDRKMKVETMTVHLGLVKASIFSIVLLTLGGILTGTAFFLGLVYGSHPVLCVFLLAIPVADYVVLRKYKQLYSLSKDYSSSNNQNHIAEDIVTLSAHNPQWITLVTQTYSFMSIILLVSRFLP